MQTCSNCRDRAFGCSCVYEACIIAVSAIACIKDPSLAQVFEHRRAKDLIGEERRRGTHFPPALVGSGSNQTCFDQSAPLRCRSEVYACCPSRLHFVGCCSLCGRRHSIRQRRLGIVDTGACPRVWVYILLPSKEGLEVMRICTFRPSPPKRTAAALRTRDLPFSIIAPIPAPISVAVTCAHESGVWISITHPPPQTLT